jgi:S-adenosylmethionine hydrolase
MFPSITRGPFEMNLGLEKLTHLATTFAEGTPGEVFVIVGSSGYLEVVANQASAARKLGCGNGSPVELILF